MGLDRTLCLVLVRHTVLRAARIPSVNQKANDSGRYARGSSSMQERTLASPTEARSAQHISTGFLPAYALMQKQFLGTYVFIDVVRWRSRDGIGGYVCII